MLPLALASMPGSLSLVRRINAELVLRVLRERGVMSRPELAAATGLSLPTVHEIMATLLRDGLVLESTTSSHPARRGPRALRLAFNAGAGHVLGIDIAASQVVVIVANLAGHIVGRHRFNPGRRAALRPDRLLPGLRECIAATLAGAALARRDVMSVAVGLPAIIDPVSGRASLVPALPEWEGFALASHLKDEFDHPPSVHTDVHLACLAETRFGVAREDGNAVYVHLGVGIGMGILQDSKVVPGFDGAAGQIGNLPISDPDDPPEAGFGMFEWTAGSLAFARQGRRAARPGSLLLAAAGGDADAVGPAEVAAAAAKGDPAARQIIERQIGYLAQGLASVVCVLNPATIILGGELAALGRVLVEPLRRALGGLVPRPPRHVIASSLGEDAVALGAVQMALQDAEARLLSGTPAKVA
jgi:predicted NBD/HSP70 family sugar kinase